MCERCPLSFLAKQQMRGSQMSVVDEILLSEFNGLEDHSVKFFLRDLETDSAHVWHNRRLLTKNPKTISIALTTKGYCRASECHVQLTSVQSSLCLLPSSKRSNGCQCRSYKCVSSLRFFVGSTRKLPREAKGRGTNNLNTDKKILQSKPIRNPTSMQLNLCETNN